MRSCTLVPEENGWPDLANSANTLIATGETFVPPLWQAKQAFSSLPRRSRTGPEALCGMWQLVQALPATVP